MGMKVNFNNLRRQTAYSYDSLTKKLNEAIECGDISKDLSCMLLRDMNELRGGIMAIASTYDTDNPDFADVGEGLEIAWFDRDDGDMIT